MKIKLILFIFPLLTFHLSLAQSPALSWVKMVGNKWNNYGHSIINDNMGNVYTTGRYLDTVDFDPGPLSYTLSSYSLNYDIYIQKLDASGNFLWAKSIGGGYEDVGNSITIDKSGNTYIAGYFKDSVDFDPGPGVYKLYGPQNAFVLKLNSLGNFVWATNVNTVSYSSTNSITLDSIGNIYVTGFGNQFAFFSKINSNGSLLWTKSLQSSLYPEPYCIKVDNQGNPVVAGLFSGTTDFDPGSGTFYLSSAGNKDGFISKFDTAGNLKWANRIGGTTEDAFYSVTLDKSGNIYTTGIYSGTVDFDPGPSSFNLASLISSGDVSIVKLDSTGAFLWAKSCGSVYYDAGLTIALDAQKNIYTGGILGGIGDFDPGPGSFTIAAEGNFVAVIDIFVSKLDSNGNFVWATAIGSSGDDRIVSISTDSQNNIYGTGWFDVTVDFDPSPGIYNISSIGGGPDDPYILKLCQTSTPIISTSGSPTLCMGNSIILTSNSASTYSWSTSANSQSIIVNSAGNYSVITTDSKGCSITSNSINVLVNPLPILNASSNNSLICTQPTQQTATLNATGANTYTWNPGNLNGNTIIVGPGVTTIYTVTGTDTLGCINSFTLTQQVSSCIGIEELFNYTALNIYPNPNNGDFTISVTGLNKTPSVEIYNTIGKLVYKDVLTAEKNNFHANLAAGIYFINIIEDNKVIATQKLICK